jgi:hypothetical protein
MISKKTKVGARGQEPSQLEHIPLLALRLDSNENDGPQVKREE